MSEKRKPYPFDQFEPKWQAFWNANQTFHAPNPGDAGFDPSKPKYYVLDMFPYPSGTGLHVGHPIGYIATDIIARYKRMRGYNVLHPMGWDAFGLPAEQYAIKTGQHPAITTAENIARFKKQLEIIGLGYDWQREINTTDPGYFKWTQWIFLKLYNSHFDEEKKCARPIAELIQNLKRSGATQTAEGSPKGETGKPNQSKIQNISDEELQGRVDEQRLAYVSEAPVNWCPALGTVLANEEVIDGKSEVGGFPVERRPMKQWMLRITKYAQRLIDELDGLDWPESIKLLQRNWIGRSDGAEVDFEIVNCQLPIANLERREEESIENRKSKIENFIRVFTTRPDTLFGATYIVLAPEHRLVDEIVTDEQVSAVEEYRKKTARKSDLERTELAKEKSGVFTGAYAINPVNNERIPIWIADYVLSGYGTGAIMAVSAHDERDFEFAKKFDLPIRQVVVAASPGSTGVTPVCDGVPPSRTFDMASRKEVRFDETSKPTGGTPVLPRIEDGIAINSPLIDGLPTAEAKTKITAWLEERGLGKKTINYKLRDWLFSRQRYWGEPFPIVWENGKHRALDESELPLTPPPLDDFKPTGTGEPPLAKAKEWLRYSDKATRETNTMPQWAGSCWYYLRYCDPQNGARFVGEEAERYWMNGWQTSEGYCLYDEATWHGIVQSMFQRAVEEKGKRPPFSLPYAHISGEFARLAKRASGDNLNEFRHAFDVYSVRHIWKQHGNPAFESARGFAAVTMEDLEKLPDILAAPDSVDFAAPHPGGLKRFITKKRVNGFIYVVEEMRSRRMQLHLITFWKQKLAAARDVTPKVPPSVTSGTFRRTSKNFAQENKTVNPGGVDLYVGGTEHAVLHLLYARFWHKVLFDLGHLSTPEPFQRLVNQGMMLGADGQKMSKSRGNVVNPDDVIAEHGADAFRLYEMFMGPLEQMKPWSMTGVEGVSRFLARVWRLVMEENQAGEWVLSPAVQDVEPDRGQLKVIHATIKKVGEDIEALSFNTAISQMMIFVNAFTNANPRPKSALRILLQLLNPFAPHLTEELWERMKEETSASSFIIHHSSLLSAQPWPSYDGQFLIEEEIEIVVQVNGKMRGKLVVKKDASNSDIEAAALAAPKIQEHTNGKTIRKVVVVPGKLVNIVVA